MQNPVDRDRRDRSRTDRVVSAAAGAAAVALALGVGELLAGLFAGVPSLVTSVGSLVIPLVPPALKDWAVQVFGTSDKVALNAGTVVIALAIGAWVGARARERFSTAVSVFAGFGTFGVFAALMQPLASPLPALLATAAAVGIGLAALWAVERAGATRPAGGGPDTRRRRLLGAVAGMAVSAAVAGWIGRSLVTAAARRQDLSLAGVEPVRRRPPPGADASFGGIEGLTPVVVPNEDFYRIDTALTVPAVDPRTWRLRITGMVDRDVELTYDELLQMDLVEAYVTLACVSNEVGDDLVGNAEWLGVPLPDVLELAGVADGATQLVGRAVDGWTAGFPTGIAVDGRDAMVAVGMNGEPLPAEHGFPARLIVPGLYGYVSATKWLTEIELTTFEAFDAYWIPRGWAERGPIKTQSRIDVPRAGEQVDAGPVVVAGVAWAGHRGVSAVEVRVNGGAWQSCELTEALSQDSWRQFRRTVELAPGDHTLTVRATDGEGEVQTARTAPPRPDGATGHHQVSVTAA